MTCYKFDPSTGERVRFFPERRQNALPTPKHRAERTPRPSPELQDKHVRVEPRKLRQPKSPKVPRHQKIKPPNCLGIDVTTIPALVTFPRSGSHWLMAMMEVYLGGLSLPTDRRPTVVSEAPLKVEWLYPSQARKNNTEFFWYFTHDFEGLRYRCTHPFGVIYLFRNPIESLYSYSSKITGLNNTAIDRTCYKFRALLDKWVLSGRAKTIITYNDMLEDPIKVLAKISAHFETPFDLPRAEFAARAMEKNRMNGKAIPNGPTGIRAHHGPPLLSNEYQAERVAYHRKFSKTIREKIINEKNKDTLMKYVPEFFEDQY